MISRDWSLESADFGGSWVKSPVFDDESGFGGNGKFVAGADIPPFLDANG
jgi:hypothetical protein